MLVVFPTPLTPTTKMTSGPPPRAGLSARGFAGSDGPPGPRRRSPTGPPAQPGFRSEEHTSELQSRENHVCRLLLEKKTRNENDDRMHRTGQYKLTHST